jgi:uncharacterized protein
MLADFLLTPKQQRILGAFLLNPARSYAISDIFELADGGRSSTQAFVKLLVDAQVLRIDSSQRGTRYAANTEHPLYPELRQIAVKSFGIKEPLEAALAELNGEAPRQVERAFIFGSIAKGTDTAESDIDVMLIGDVRLGRASRVMEAASRRLGREVHVNVYPAAEWEELRLADPVVRAINEGPRIELDTTPSAHAGAV